MEQRSRLALTFCALPVFVGLLLAGPAHADRLDNGDGTVTDVASGLTWVADPDFAARPRCGALDPSRRRSRRAPRDELRRGRELRAP